MSLLSHTKTFLVSESLLGFLLITADFLSLLHPHTVLVIYSRSIESMLKVFENWTLHFVDEGTEAQRGQVLGPVTQLDGASRPHIHIISSIYDLPRRLYPSAFLYFLCMYHICSRHVTEMPFFFLSSCGRFYLCLVGTSFKYLPHKSYYQEWD